MHYNIVIDFEAGQDTSSATFREVYAVSEAQAHEFGWMVAKQLGLKATIVSVFPLEMTTGSNKAHTI